MTIRTGSFAFKIIRGTTSFSFTDIVIDEITTAVEVIGDVSNLFFNQFRTTNTTGTGIKGTPGQSLVVESCEFLSPTGISFNVPRENAWNLNVSNSLFDVVALVKVEFL